MIDELIGGTQLGIVAFSDFAQIVVPPTRGREALREAIETLTTSIGTAVGSATLHSIDAISEVDSEVQPSGANAAGRRRPDRRRVLPGRERRSIAGCVPQPAEPDHAADARGGAELCILGSGRCVRLPGSRAFVRLEQAALALILGLSESLRLLTAPAASPRRIRNRLAGLQPRLSMQ